METINKQIQKITKQARLEGFVFGAIASMVAIAIIFFLFIN